MAKRKTKKTAEPWSPPEGEPYHPDAKDPKCGHVVANYQTGKTKAIRAKADGGCNEGCCDYYRCNHCNKLWVIEWPD